LNPCGLHVLTVVGVAGGGLSDSGRGYVASDRVTRHAITD